MPDHGPILRPRHLFPEVAAVAIQSRRGALRLRRRVRQEIERVPVWTVGATAGTVGVMLAILLFFLPEPVVVAAPGPETMIVPEIEPTPAFPSEPDDEVLPVFPPAVSDTPRSRPNLRAELTRTRLPLFWDQREEITLRSRPASATPIWNRLPADDWRVAVDHLPNDPPVTPYQPSDTVAAPISTLASSSVVPPLQSPDAARSLGLSVEKLLPSSSVPGRKGTYRIIVRNTNVKAVENVIVRERLPSLRSVIDVTPPAAVVGEELVWDLGTLDGMGKREMSVTLKPDQTGHIHAETRVEVASQLAAIAQVQQPRAVPQPDPPVTPPVPVETRPEPALSEQPRPFPELKLAVSPVGVMRQGDTLSLTFTVTNVGTAVAEGVDLYVKLSSEFQHRYGEHVKHHIDRLEPGQTRRALLQAIVKQSGDARLGASLKLQGHEEESRELTISIEPSREGQVHQSPFFDVPNPASRPPGATSALTDLRWTATVP